MVVVVVVVVVVLLLLLLLMIPPPLYQAWRVSCSSARWLLAARKAARRGTPRRPASRRGRRYIRITQGSLL